MFGSKKKDLEIEDTQYLINQLHDKNYKKRKYAADKLGERGDTSAVPHLIKILLNRNEERIGYDQYVRQSAAIALGKLKDPSAVEPLLRVLGDFSFGDDWNDFDGSFHREVLIALKKFDVTWAGTLSKVLFSYCDSEVSKIRRDRESIECAELFLTVSDERTWIPIWEAFESGNPRLQENAVVLIGKIAMKLNDKKLIDILINKLNEYAAINVLEATIKALSETNSVEAANVILQKYFSLSEELNLLNKDINNIFNPSDLRATWAEKGDVILTILYQVEDALVKMGTLVVEPLILKMENKSIDIILRLDIAEILGNIGNATAIQPLNNFLSEIPKPSFFDKDGKDKRKRIETAIKKIEKKMKKEHKTSGE